MARRPKEDMEIQVIKTHLDKQDKILAEQIRKQDGLMDTMKDILTILGGSVAMGIPGIRQEVKDLKVTAADLKEKFSGLEQSVKQSESTKGQWIIRLNSIPGFLVTAVVFIGGVIGIVLGIRDLVEGDKQEKENVRNHRSINHTHPDFIGVVFPCEGLQKNSGCRQAESNADNNLNAVRGAFG